MPFDFIEDTAATQGVTVDREAYDRAMEGQRDKARAGSAFGAGKKGDEFALAADAVTDRMTARRSVRGIHAALASAVCPCWRSSTSSGSRPTSWRRARPGTSSLARTPFYLEAGGQVSDSGRIFSEATAPRPTVEGLVRIRPGLPRAHRVRVDVGTLRVRDLVTAEVDADVRDATRRNHTATHLLHAALREVLGTHVKQAGSLVAPDRLRFDFVHFQPVTRDELDRIEQIVNEQIYRNTPVDDRGAADVGGHGGRRDGAFRREVRRYASAS